MPLTAANANAMLADMKRRANARHAANTARALAAAPSPPRNPQPFRSNNRAVRRNLARAPSPPRANPCARAAEHRRMLLQRMQRDAQQYQQLVQRMQRDRQLLAALQRC